jgi:hypothetical protein
VSAAFERGVLPFATLRADLAALAGAALPGPRVADATPSEPQVAATVGDRGAVARTATARDAVGGSGR